MIRHAIGLLLLLGVLPAGAQQDWNRVELTIGPAVSGAERAVGPRTWSGGANGSVLWNWNRQWGLQADFTWVDARPFTNITERLVETITFISGIPPTAGTGGRPDTKQGEGHGTCNPNAATSAVPGCAGMSGDPGTPDQTIVERHTEEDITLHGFDSRTFLMVGPRYQGQPSFLTRSDWPKFTVYGLAQIGWVRSSLAGVRENHFGMAFGGGGDYTITPWLSVRVFQLTYVPVKVGCCWHNDMTMTAGAVFKFLHQED